MSCDPAPILAVAAQASHLERLRERGWPVIGIATGAPVPATARGAQILLYWAKERAPAARYVAELPALQWMHVPWVGIERLLFPRVVSGEVTLTHSPGVASIPVAEYAIGALLAISKNLPAHWHGQQRGHWRQDEPSRELNAARLLIVGYGHIGREIGRRATALGMRVRGIASTERVDGVVPVHGPEALERWLPESDYVVCATPSRPDTRRMFDAARLARMRPEAWLVNVGRGDAIDEAALLAAVRSRAIAGAWLDVVTEEPLPADSPLWHQPGVVITPHVSSWTPQRFERSFALFVRNLEARARGEPLRHAVVPGVAVHTP